MLSLIGLFLVLAQASAEISGLFKSISEVSIVSESAKATLEVFDDQKFITFDSIYNSTNILTGLSVKIVGPNNTTRECILPIIAQPLEIRRLGNKTTLLVVTNVDNVNVTKLALVNIDKCNYTYNIYSGDLPIRGYDFFTSNDTSDERFALIVRGQEYCHGRNWCRLFFDPQFRKFEPLDFDFLNNVSHASVEPVTTFEGNLLVARFTDDNNTHHMRLYNISNDNSSIHEELLTIGGYKSDGMIFGKLEENYNGSILHDVAVSGRSYCWRKHFEIAGSDRVHCTKFHENGTVMFNKTINYKEPVTYIRVESIPNGLIFFSGSEADCERYSCDTVRVVVLTRDADGDSDSIEEDVVEDKRREYDFGCKIYDIDSDIKVRVDELTKAIELEYICNNVKAFSLNKLTIA